MLVQQPIFLYLLHPVRSARSLTNITPIVISTQILAVVPSWNTGKPEDTFRQAKTLMDTIGEQQEEVVKNKARSEKAETVLYHVPAAIYTVQPSLKKLKDDDAVDAIRKAERMSLLSYLQSGT